MLVKNSKRMPRELLLMIGTICTGLHISVILGTLYLIPVRDITIHTVGELVVTDSSIDGKAWEEYSGKPFLNSLPPIYATNVTSKEPTNLLDFLSSFLVFKFQGGSPSIHTRVATVLEPYEDLLTPYEVFSEMLLHSLVSAKRELNSLDIDVKPTFHGGTSKLQKNNNVFELSDIILSIDGVAINSLLDYLSLKKSWNLQYGVRHVFTLLREGIKQEIPFTYTVKDGDQLITGMKILDTIADEKHPHLIEILFKYDSKTFGDSAGIMHALNLVQRISDTNLTKGYKIAGTGRIELDGKVGPIASMDLKVKTADRENVDIYFVPKYYPISRWENITYENSNEKEALDTAAKIHTKMKIVPVETLREAIDYLSNLPER